MSDIFISYSHSDRDYVRKLADALRQEQFSVWLDENIDYGDRWFATIVREIKASSAVIVVMTPEAEASEWVEREIHIALDEEKPIFPLLLRGKRLPLLITKQYVNVLNEQLPPKSFYQSIARAVPQQNAENFTLPLLEWCYVPSKTVKIVEKVYSLDSYYMAKYPVTNAQYAAFVIDTDGYSNPRWWSHTDHAYEWHQNNPTPEKPRFSKETNPREMVTWYEAMAFCQWLSDKTRSMITLPSPAQRRLAVQGDDLRLFPWGNEFDSTKCNTRENLIRKTTPVTRYPTGASPYGVMDLSGNVWEWGLPGFESLEPLEDIEVIKRPVFGGGWRGRRRHAQAVYPRIYNAEYKAPDVGFRCIRVLSK